MPQINVLPKEVYQLIAAGEVVERPSSVVKEMIENSVDAGAKSITVEIRRGGTDYIRITDDGCGIDKDQVEKVFIPHATSKIKYADDLNSIGTLGFRGEAMASVAAVAKVELLSRTSDSDIGSRYEIAGGEKFDFSEVGCPKGTTIVVRDLFFNTPARMKFLKKDVTEGNAVAGVVDRMAISHPEISFRFIRDGKQTLITSGSGDLKSTVYSVFGREFSSALIDVDYSVNNMRLTGVVTKPAQSRKSRAMQFFYINNRLVKSKTVMAALEQAYKNNIMVGRFPGCVLNIECDLTFVDVNVHPAKTEVRFANERPVFELIYYGVKSAIETGDTFKEAKITPKPVYENAQGRFDFVKDKDNEPQQIVFKQKPKNDNFWNVASTQDYKNDFGENAKLSIKENEKDKINISLNRIFDTSLKPAPPDKGENKIIKSLDEDKEKQQAPSYNEIEIPDFRVIGEAFKTYIIIEIDKNLYFIDKHAAHERMNFEKLKSETEINSQILLSPVAVKLSKDEYTAVCENLDLYKKCGFVIEDFGNSSVIVRECPSILDNEDVEDLVTETAQKLLDGKTDITPEQMDWIFHSTSCRAAVKAGDYTSPYERELFVKKLLSMPEIRYCPHGRPVLIKMSKYEIEKQFGRV